MAAMLKERPSFESGQILMLGAQETTRSKIT
jgi:hypothetical protein